MTQVHRLMVVDDEDVNIDLLRLIFDRDFEIIAACDGIDALIKLESLDGVDAMLLDRMMPHMDGTQL